MSTTPSEVFTEVAKAYTKYAADPYLREGQKWFSALYDVNRNIAMQIVGNKNLDPFNKDQNLENFFLWLSDIKNS